MRITFQEGREGVYCKPPFKGRVVLNGQPMSGVVTADEERGEIEALARDANGDLILSSDRAEVVTWLAKGVVKIEFPA